MPEIHSRFNVSPEDLLAHLTEASYQAVLKHGLKAPFIDVALDIQTALRAVIQQDMLVSPACGSKECQEAARYLPWSLKGKSLFCQT